jgi:hypothetical protein
MNTGIFPQPRMPRLQGHVSNAGAEIAGKPGTADSPRAVGNVQLWDSYLPADCVSTMVRMGWDKTT